MPKHKRRHLESKRKRFETKGHFTPDPSQSSATSSAASGNPFEFHRNKVKHTIIGRKLAKNEFGNKGLSRNRAFNKRKNTLLHEYQTKHKSGRGVQDLRTNDNGLNDQWKDRNLSIEKSFGDSPQLTHKGKQLNDFIDDTIGSDDEDIDVFNRPEFVESAHFGGGSDGRPKSANEVLNQIMDEKREKQLERAANVELTQKLDTEWSAIKSILRHKGVQHEIGNTEDFDILVKELKFDSRTKPITISQTLPQPTKDVSDSEQVVQKSAKTLFKEIIEEIEKKSDWKEIMSSVKNAVNNVMPQLNEESLPLLIEKYQTIIGTKIDFNPQNFAFLLIGTYFKQTKPIVTTILAHMLSKLRFKTFKDIATGLVIIRTLMISSNGKYIPEVFVSILDIIRLTENPNQLNDKKNKIKTNCILYLEKDTNEENVSFDPKYSFDKTLDNSPNLSETQIKTMLTIEAIESSDQSIDLYSTFPSFNQLIAPIKSEITRLSTNSSKTIRERVDKVLAKLNSDQFKEQLSSMVESRPKPFILPMLEPKFELKSNSFTKKNPKKKLTKKYKRELKGAQRELRKDSVFLRNTWINEINVNDKKRKDKVKEILGDLAIQQGLYKKKKKK